MPLTRVSPDTAIQEKCELTADGRPTWLTNDGTFLDFLKGNQLSIMQPSRLKLNTFYESREKRITIQEALDKLTWEDTETAAWRTLNDWNDWNVLEMLVLKSCEEVLAQTPGVTDVLDLFKSLALNTKPVNVVSCDKIVSCGKLTAVDKFSAFKRCWSC